MSNDKRMNDVEMQLVNHCDGKINENGDIEIKSIQLDLPQENFLPIELYWENINIVAKIKEKKGPCRSFKYDKIILNKVKGKASPGSFLAIIGPSGCGKTTLLNFLSGRLFSKNLKTSGSLKINGNSVDSVDLISNQMAYVMQDDILFATFSPREAFTFSARLRLKLSSEEELRKTVDFFLKLLDLIPCAETKIGNNLIRGVSGGERKRTSIGVELLTNPSVIFLDEPTTGLDSASAANIIDILKALTKKGRTIMSTIHQPSSEIFAKFDQLQLLVKGEAIYQGKASDALKYFETSLHFTIPEFCNPSTFLMKCMNAEGLLVEQMQLTKNYNIKFDENIHKNFKERLDKMVETYQNSPEYKDIRPEETHLIPVNKKRNQALWVTEFVAILVRAFKNELRNPMDLRAKTAATIIFSAVCIIVFEGIGNYRAGIQNRTGVLFFLCMQSTFGSIMGSLLTFSSEKPVFLRERLNRTYRTSSYFWGRSCSELPFHFCFPTLMISIVYYAVGLNDAYPWKILLLILIQNGIYFYGVSFGMLLSIIFPSAEMAISLAPVLIIPLLVFAGFFVNQNNIPYYFYPIQYISSLKYGFQASIFNEFEDIDYYCAPKIVCHPLTEFNFPENLRDSVIILWALGIALRILAYLSLSSISEPKIQKLRPDNQSNQQNKIQPHP